jgi:hypothetical protein
MLSPGAPRQNTQRNRNPILMPSFSPFTYENYSKTSKNAEKYKSANYRNSRLSSNGSQNDNYKDQEDHQFSDNRQV